ncbi:hypothetical protein HK103_000749 [Boothiomyces macroporosus]|uniref:Uncharacterized protein n=1 Tax=Boothiomyces macroporosus TaxID=261099 RepID=A0AAD5UB52_9FUNG|nr:hypothetical protein HK103_000749 [Boothiomyces macroporosus]
MSNQYQGFQAFQQQQGYPPQQAYPQPPYPAQQQNPQPQNPQQQQFQQGYQQTYPPQQGYQQGYQQGPQQAYQQPQYSPQQGYPPAQPGYPPANLPPAPVQGQRFSAYPEYDNQANIVANKSYQNVSGAGWNDPPLASKALKDQEILHGVSNPESTIVSIITDTLDAVKQNSRANPRMIEDTDKRLEFLFDRLANKQVAPILLAPAYKISLALSQRDFGTAKSAVTALMAGVPQDDTKWIVGMKRLVELYEQI